MTPLTTAARELHELTASLAKHKEAATVEETRLRGEIEQRHKILELSAAGIDLDKVALARTILYVRGSYSRGGSEKASVIQDAIKQLASGQPVRPIYSDLWRQYFGTKDYDRWSGQRTDCDYGCGPRHGSIVFAVGITSETRTARTQSSLTPDEIEAAIYFLSNIARIQAAEDAARNATAA